jgi:hypothetical protein
MTEPIVQKAMTERIMMAGLECERVAPVCNKVKPTQDLEKPWTSMSRMLLAKKY